MHLIFMHSSDERPRMTLRATKDCPCIPHIIALLT